MGEFPSPPPNLSPLQGFHNSLCSAALEISRLQMQNCNKTNTYLQKVGFLLKLHLRYLTN